MLLTHIVSKELKQFLTTRGAYEQCLSNLDAEHLQEFFKINSINTISTFFLWWNTPQGFSYWNRLDDLYAEHL